jgi:hypothetical protein
VFLVPHQEKGINKSFVIERSSGGVDLTNFTDCVNDRCSVIGVKRLAKPWFNDEVQCDVRGRMLNMIKSSYDYSTIIKLARKFVRDLAFGVKSRIYGPTRAIRTAREREIKPPNKFICSGIVQLGFIHTLMDLAGEKRHPPQFLSGIIFRDDLKTFLPEDWEQFTAAEQEEIFYDFVVGFSDLKEANTPEDLAATPELEWVYVIRRGKVYTGNSTSRSANCSPGNPARNASAEGGEDAAGFHFLLAGIASMRRARPSVCARPLRSWRKHL